MTDKLPPNLLALFAPRPALRYLPPSDHAPKARSSNIVSGVGQYLEALREYDDDYEATESWLQRKDREKLERKAKVEKDLKAGLEKYKPADDPNARGDAYKTLFVSRLSYDTETKDLEREFGRFGAIERIRIVPNISAKSGSKKRNRGYAFVVYEREKDMKAAYKETDGIRIKDRRVCVDVERGRTTPGWRPRRLGGGLGGRGYTKAAPPRPIGSGFGGPPSGPGFRGGFGGRGGGRGFRGGFGDRGGFRGGYGGRGGIGYQQNGFGGPPEGAPSGPRGGGRGGFGGGGSYGGREDRGSFRNRGGASGSNSEPVAPRRDRDRDGGGRDGGSSYGGGRDGGSRDGGGYRDRERDRDRDRERDRDRDRGRDRDRDGGYGRDDHSRKRYHDGDSYDDSRSKRRY